MWLNSTRAPYAVKYSEVLFPSEHAITSKIHLARELAKINVSYYLMTSCVWAVFVGSVLSVFLLMLMGRCHVQYAVPLLFPLT